MKFAAVAFLTAILIAGFGNCSKVQAQDYVSPNLVYMTTNPWQGAAGTSPGSWSNNFTSNATATGGGLSGGSQPVYNTATGTFPQIVFTGASAGASVITLQVLDDNTISFSSKELETSLIQFSLSIKTSPSIHIILLYLYGSLLTSILNKFSL